MFGASMIMPNPTSATPQPSVRLKTLDRVIEATSLIQKPLFVMILRGLPSASVVLGMTFLAPKVQEFYCVPDRDLVNDMMSRPPRSSSMQEARCYRNSIDKCDAWTYSSDIFEETIKSEASP